MALGNVTQTFFNLGSFGLIKKGTVKGFFDSRQASSDVSPQPLPQPPSADAAAKKGAETVRRRMASMTRSIYTSPLGIAGEAQVARKTLLGQ